MMLMMMVVEIGLTPRRPAAAPRVAVDPEGLSSRMDTLIKMPA